MWVLVLVLIGIIGWMLLRRPTTNATSNTAPESALAALLEADALVVNAWQELQALIEGTEDPDLTCARIVAGRKDELPAKIRDLWAYVDDLSERANRRAEHYEVVSRTGAPTLSGRAVGETVVAGIRRRADRAAGALMEAGTRGAQPTTNPEASARSLGSTLDEDKLVEAPGLRVAIEAYEAAWLLLKKHGFHDDRILTPKQIYDIAENAPRGSLVKLTIQLISLQVGVMGGGLSRETALSTLKEKRAYYVGLRDADPTAWGLVEPTIALYDLFVSVLSKLPSGPAKAAPKGE